MIVQPECWDLDERYAHLSKTGEPLERLKGLLANAFAGLPMRLCLLDSCIGS